MSCGRSFGWSFSAQSIARRNSALYLPLPSASALGSGSSVAQARGRLDRLLARDQPEERGAHRVDVGPGPLAAAARVLLDRAVAGRDHRADVRGLARGLARGAEVEQHEAAVLVAHVDVVGLDVAVQVARAVHHREAVEERREERDDLVLGDVRALLAPGLERLAALVLEHHVRGLVRLEEARHAHDVRVPEGGERARLDEEAVEAALVEVLVVVGARRDRVVDGAVGEVLGQVLLDDHLGVEVHVGGGVGDAEAALAQDRVDAVLEQAEADREASCWGRRASAAGRARGSLAAGEAPAPGSRTVFSPARAVGRPPYGSTHRPLGSGPGRSFSSDANARRRACWSGSTNGLFGAVLWGFRPTMSSRGPVPNGRTRLNYHKIAREQLWKSPPGQPLTDKSFRNCARSVIPSCGEPP